jgi:hypothetical protein
LESITLNPLGRKVVRIVIHVVAVGDLNGPAVTAAVMGDDAIAVIEEEKDRAEGIGKGKFAPPKDDPG